MKRELEAVQAELAKRTEDHHALEHAVRAERRSAAAKVQEAEQAAGAHQRAKQAAETELAATSAEVESLRARLEAARSAASEAEVAVEELTSQRNKAVARAGRVDDLEAKVNTEADARQLAQDQVRTRGQARSVHVRVSLPPCRARAAHRRPHSTCSSVSPCEASSLWRRSSLEPSAASPNWKPT